MPHELPSLFTLRAFEAVARLESVKAAAQELQVTPGAISQQLRKFEEGLERSNRRVSPTEAGRQLQKELQGSFRRIERALEQAGGSASSDVAIGAAPSFNAKCILPRLPALTAALPEVGVSLLIERDYRRLMKSEFDIAVLFVETPPRRLSYCVLREERLVALASPEYAADHEIRQPRDLLDVTLIADDSMKSFGIEIPTWEDWFAAVGLSANALPRALSFDSHASHALDSAIAGQGVVLGRQTLALGDIRAGRLVQLFTPELPMRCTYMMMARSDRLEDPAVRATWDWMRDSLIP